MAELDIESEVNALIARIRAMPIKHCNSESLAARNRR